MIKDEELSIQEIMDLALTAGLFCHQSGGDAAHTGRTMNRLALALGADKADTVIASINIGITVEKKGIRTTAFRKAPHMGANFAMLTAVTRLVDAVVQKRIGARVARIELERIERRPRHYHPAVIAPLVGLSCGGFAALFGGDTPAIVCTIMGSGLGMALRLLMFPYYKPFMFALAASFTALTTTGLLLRLLPSHSADAALAASVLFLIPGVPFINGAADLFTAHYLNGMVRIMMGVIFVIGIATGVSLGLRAL